jgi:DNA-binding response OmpR family regulator
MRRILVVEDDPDIALSLKYNMEKEGTFSVVVTEDGERGLAEAARRPPDLIVLDLNLPGMDGFEVCRRLRTGSATSTIPVIMLTARIEEADMVAGLELGADDYVTKPFSVREIVARARAILRRAQAPREDKEILSSGVLTLDLGARRVLVEDREVTLTRKEFDLLADLVHGRGRVLSRELLLERVWGYDHPGETRTVDVHVRQLRKKLGPAADGYIETVVGVGYRFRGDT